MEGRLGVGVLYCLYLMDCIDEWDGGMASFSSLSSSFQIRCIPRTLSTFDTVLFNNDIHNSALWLHQRQC